MFSRSLSQENEPRDRYGRPERIDVVQESIDVEKIGAGVEDEELNHEDGAFANNTVRKRRSPIATTCSVTAFLLLFVATALGTGYILNMAVEAVQHSKANNKAAIGVDDQNRATSYSPTPSDIEEAEVTVTVRPV